LDTGPKESPPHSNHAASNRTAGADAIKAKEWTEDELQTKRETSARLNPGRHLRPGYLGPHRTDAERKRRQTLPDAEVAGVPHKAQNVKADERQRRGTSPMPLAPDGGSPTAVGRPSC
jgi:hypothetical protein